MAYLDKSEIKKLYQQSKTDARVWRKDYAAYERLADNELMDGLDPNLPEVNDGSLAAYLFKLPKRIVSSRLRGEVKVTDRNEAWLAELANLQWQNEIIPNANSQAPFHRKWKDAVRKAAIYGSVPLVTLFVERDGKTYTDFIVAQPQDVSLEPGKASDYDSDVLFWDVYFSKLQVEDMIEQAKSEKDDNDDDSYNKWNIPALTDILATDEEESRDGADTPNQENHNVKPKGYRFCVVVQRGKDAPFYMYHHATNRVVREWSNPDPTGDVPIHYLYCYQDLINPYGIGIVKLAGGTQNVLDYMRQADVLATQLGLRPPVAVEGNEDDVDVDSMVYAQDAIWFLGQAKIQRQELANGVYSQLPQRIEMYKNSLNQLIPMGDTSVSSGAGDPLASKTPAGVKLQASNLSIDDDDFRDNLYITYAAVAKSMINTHFASMEGRDLMQLTDDERDILKNAGLQFPTTPEGQLSNQVELVWDNIRAHFDFEVDPSSGIKTNDAEQMQSIKDVLGTLTPQVNYYLGQAGWKFNLGEAYHSLFMKMNLDNVEDIITKMTDEEKQQSQGQPFPIIDPPQIRLTGQIPNGAMSAALAQGGVNLPDGINTMSEQIDLGDIYKDPTTGPSVKAQIQQMANLQPEIVQQAAETPAPTGPTPDELALRQRELDIKQQSANQKTAEIALKADQQHHNKAMDMIREATAPDPVKMAQAKTEAKA